MRVTNGFGPFSRFLWIFTNRQLTMESKGKSCGAHPPAQSPFQCNHGVVDRIIDMLDHAGKVEHICTFDLPRSENVIRILDLISKLLFPGYFGKKAPDREKLKMHLCNTANDASELLESEIRKCLIHASHDNSARSQKAVKEAGAITEEFFRGLPDMIGILDGDVQAAYLGDPAATGSGEVIICYPGFRAIMIQRIAHNLHSLGTPLLPRTMTEYAHGLTGIDIHPAARIGENFFIDHGTGVVIGETTEIGNNVKIYQGVTLGALSFPTGDDGKLKRGFKRHPTIEDDVVIYSNASILGNVTIGKGAVIGGNVFLSDSVAPGSKVSRQGPGHRVRNRNQQ